MWPVRSKEIANVQKKKKLIQPSITSYLNKTNKSKDADKARDKPIDVYLVPSNRVSVLCCPLGSPAVPSTTVDITPKTRKFNTSTLQTDNSLKKSNEGFFLDTTSPLTFFNTDIQDFPTDFHTPKNQFVSVLRRFRRQARSTITQEINPKRFRFDEEESSFLDNVFGKQMQNDSKAFNLTKPTVGQVSPWTSFLLTEEKMEDLSPTPKKHETIGMKQSTCGINPEFKISSGGKSSLDYSDQNVVTPKSTSFRRSKSSSFEEKSSLLLNVLKSGCEMLDSVEENLEFFSPNTQQKLKTKRLDAVISGVSDSSSETKSLVDICKVATEMIDDLENDLNNLNCNSLKTPEYPPLVDLEFDLNYFNYDCINQNSPKAAARRSKEVTRRRLLGQFYDSSPSECCKSDFDDLDRHTPKDPCQIKVPSLYFPVLQRDPAAQNLRTELDKLGITRYPWSRYTFKDCLFEIGEEMARGFANRNGKKKKKITVIRVRSCLYCSFETESRLVLGQHLKEKHKGKMRMWPYSRKMRFCTTLHDSV